MRKLNLAKISHSFQGQKMFEIYAKTKKLKKKIYHFELGEPSHLIPKNIVNETIRSIKSGNTNYVKSNGIDELRELVRRTTYTSRGFTPDLDQILVTPGANSIIYFTHEMYLRSKR